MFSTTTDYRALNEDAGSALITYEGKWSILRSCQAVVGGKITFFAVAVIDADYY